MATGKTRLSEEDIEDLRACNGMGSEYDQIPDDIAIVGTGPTMGCLPKDNPYEVWGSNGAASYLKIYDSLGPTIGTTDPDWILPVAASVQRTFLFTEDDVMGLTIANGISYGCVTAGGTAGTTSPTSSVILDGVANA